MANIKSAQKRARQSDIQRKANMSLRTMARTAIKNARKAIAAGDKTAATAALLRSQSVIDRVTAKGILHRNAADRQKSRLAHAMKALQQ